MTPGTGDLCEHGKLFCMVCDFEYVLIVETARKTGHERECRCQQCAIIRRDARRKHRKSIVELAHIHEATPETRGQVYEYCPCGAVRTLDRNRRQYESWHVCALCSIGEPPTSGGEPPRHQE